MDSIRKHLRFVSLVMALLFSLGSISATVASATMVGTGDMIAVQQVQVDRQQLLDLLEQPEVKSKLAQLGVSDDQARDRIQSLTAQELAEFDQQLADAPAGQDVVGIVVLLFIVFIVTDMLCATDIFSFVNCVQ